MLTILEEKELIKKAEWIVNRASHFLNAYGEVTRETLGEFLGIDKHSLYNNKLLNTLFKETKNVRRKSGI